MKDTEQAAHAQVAKRVEAMMEDVVLKSLHTIQQASSAITIQRTALASTLSTRATPETSFLPDMDVHVVQLHSLSKELVDQGQLDLCAAEKIVKLLDHLGAAATEHAQSAEQFARQSYLTVVLPRLRDAAHTWRSYARWLR